MKSGNAGWSQGWRRSCVIPARCLAPCFLGPLLHLHRHPLAPSALPDFHCYYEWLRLPRRGGLVLAGLNLDLAAAGRCSLRCERFRSVAAPWVSLVPCSSDCRARSGLGPRGVSQRSPLFATARCGLRRYAAHRPSRHSFRGSIPFQVRLILLPLLLALLSLPTAVSGPDCSRTRKAGYWSPWLLATQGRIRTS